MVQVPECERQFSVGVKQLQGVSLSLCGAFRSPPHPHPLPKMTP